MLSSDSPPDAYPRKVGPETMLPPRRGRAPQCPSHSWEEQRGVGCLQLGRDKDLDLRGDRGRLQFPRRRNWRRVVGKAHPQMKRKTTPLEHGDREWDLVS